MSVETVQQTYQAKELARELNHSRDILLRIEQLLINLPASIFGQNVLTQLDVTRLHNLATASSALAQAAAGLAASANTKIQ
jgi:hypothetical protein